MTSQAHLGFEITPAEMAGLWRVYTLDHDRAEVMAQFERRYGTPPARVVEHGGLLWVGPIPEGGHDGQVSVLLAVPVLS